MKKQSAVKKYLAAHPNDFNEMMLAYVSELDMVSEVSPLVASKIVSEVRNQRSHLKLIASENYSSPAVHLSMGNLLTDKYAEGFAYHRYYAGCENVDAIEDYACKKACEVFGAEHAYVQPHSGADANLCAYWAILNATVQIPSLEEMGLPNSINMTREQWTTLRHKLGNQRLLGLDYFSGGHLTHGYRLNISGQMFDSYSYSVNKETGLLDYDEILKQAMIVKPLILLAGYSAYPRKINFRKMREIADACGAVLMCDMAHFSGLVAGKVFEGDYNPVLWADVVTTTTHKTLRGPRGGMILCKQKFADSVDQGCPLVIGGPLPHVLAAKAVALTEADTEEFREYSRKIVENAKTLAQGFADEGLRLQTDGTDNHLMLLDVTSFGINGRQAESALLECGIILNRNALPFDPNGVWYTSGLRIGTPALTTLGMGSKEMKEIASIITFVLRNTRPAKITKGEKAGTLSRSKAVVDPIAKEQAYQRVQNLLSQFVLYPELDLEFLEENFCK
ncbi:MAG: glycine hydroxymethyltransferase [Sphaerochaetaceae bacterium]|nr:glycine hydroxymethyltransferase [Sphaerochaetaceae bacterium]